MLHGVDVSHHQDPDRIDWPRLASSGVSFAYVRATYGVSPDETFVQHMERARQAGLHIGAYHFLRFRASQPAEAQAEAFLEALEPLAPHATAFLPPMLDLEDNVNDDQIKTADDRRRYITMANVWLKTVEQRLGRLAGIYTRASFFDDTMGGPAGFSTRPLWVAHYTSKPAPNIPQSWARHVFWQFTDSGQLPGYNGKIDRNRFEGDAGDLLALTQDHSFGDSPIPDPHSETRDVPLGTGALVVMRVAAKGLSLRSAPVISNQSFIISLPLGHRVEVLEQGIAGQNGGTWARVRCFVGSAQQEGFMSQSYLRPLARASVEALVDAAVAEWKRFKMGAGQETMPPFYDYVGQMWRNLNPASTITGKNTDQFWSAAAMSWFMHNAGPAYAGFRQSAQHSVYIHDAIVKRQAGQAAPFWGYRLNERPAEVGDLVCIDRTGAGIDFDFAADHASFSSHTDVIVGIHNGIAVTLGGNVSNSVATKEWALTDTGHLVQAGRLFALMKNTTP